MKYIGILALLAVACLLAAPALSIGDGMGPMDAQNGNVFQGNCGQYCSSCQCNGPCGGEALGAQNQYGQDNAGSQGAGIGAQDRDRARDGSCDGTGPKRDGSCRTAA